MKILYASYRYDPTNPDLGSSVDYECFRAFQNAEISIELLGPLDKPKWLIERIEIKLWQIYKRLVRKAGMKFPLTTSLRASWQLKKTIKKTNPDIIFSLFPPFFVFFQSKTPCVWYFDTTFIGQEMDWPLYGKLSLKLSVWQEKQSLKHLRTVITMSEWSRKILINHYQMVTKNIEIIPVAATIPSEIVDKESTKPIDYPIKQPIKLLLVGRVYKRKGIDIAFEVVEHLKCLGFDTHLKICGLSDPPIDVPTNIEFVGPYKKSDPYQLQTYINLYKWAHLLIHPARFEAAGIVPSEAAAFGTPTITNDTGGLGTSVKDGISGVVLPRGSPPESYAKAIRDLVEDR